MTIPDDRVSGEGGAGVPREEAWDAVTEGEAASLASIWRCPSCGAQIQIIVAPATIPKQPFICMDGTPMVAGQSH